MNKFDIPIISYVIFFFLLCCMLVLVNSAFIEPRYSMDLTRTQTAQERTVVE